MQPPNLEQLQARPRQNLHQRGGKRAFSEKINPPRSPQSRPHSTNITPSTNIFINYIPADYTEIDLRNICQQFGDIICSKIMINLETGQSKCFGFVRFATLEQAQAAIRGLNGLQIGTKRLLAKYAESREKQEKISMTIYIKRLPITIDTNYVMHLFSRFGVIQSMTPHVLDSVDPNFWRCFIRYNAFQAASNAIAAMNNQIILPGTRPIHVRYADESRLSGNISLPEAFIQGSPFIDETEQMQLLPSFLMK